MPPAELTDDQIVEAIAAEVATRVIASHPTAKGKMLRQLTAIAVAQAVGELPPPGQIRDHQLAQYFGVSRQRIGQERTTALARAWHAATQLGLDEA